MGQSIISRDSQDTTFGNILSFEVRAQGGIPFNPIARRVFMFAVGVNLGTEKKPTSSQLRTAPIFLVGVGGDSFDD